MEIESLIRSRIEIVESDEEIKETLRVTFLDYITPSVDKEVEKKQEVVSVGGQVGGLEEFISSYGKTTITNTTTTDVTINNVPTASPEVVVDEELMNALQELRRM